MPMKEFKFEITITEDDLEGDEFWEDAIKRDGTGIQDLTHALIRAIDESNLILNSERNIADLIKLISYKEK